MVAAPRRRWLTLTGYVVTPYVGYTPLPSTTVDSPVTAKVVTGLLNGTTYRFRVRALNAAGTSVYSTVTNALVPTATPNQASGLAVGGLHACAVVGGGGIRCWGDNATGQLGDGTVASPALPDTTSVPVSVVGISGATAVAVGDSHSCALVADAPCGAGAPTGSCSSAPVTTATRRRRCRSPASPAPPPSPPTARTRAPWWRAGPIKCWGDNGFGQLGNGTTDRSARRP